MFASTILPIQLSQEQRLFQNQARQIVAKKLKNSKHASAILNFLNGHPINKLNDFRISSVGNAIKIVAVGEESAKYWLTISEEISDLICSESNRNSATTTVGRYTADPSHGFKLYKLKNLVWLGKQRETVEGKRQFPIFSKKKALELQATCIKKSLLAQIDAYGICWDEDAHPLHVECYESQTDIPQDVYSFKPIRISDEGGHYGMNCNVEFRINAKLIGPWSFGKLLGRGYGAIKTQY